MFQFKEIEQNFEESQVKQNKKNPYLCLYIYVIYAWLCIEEQTYEHLVYTSQMQRQITNFK